MIGQGSVPSLLVLICKIALVLQEIHTQQLHTRTHQLLQFPMR
jgi:hypothetical protein